MLHWKCWCKVRLEIYFIEKAKIRYSWGLFYWKGRNKVRRGFTLFTILKWAQLGTYFIENDEIRYGSGLILLKRNLLHWNCWSNVRLGIYAIKSRNKVRLRIYFIERVKIRYDLGLIHWKDQIKARLENCFIEHETLDTAVDLFHLKCWNEVRLWIYSNEKSTTSDLFYWIDWIKVQLGTTSPTAHLFVIRGSAWKTIFTI